MTSSDNAAKPMALVPEFVEEALSILGAKGCLTLPGDMDSYLADWRGRRSGFSPMVALPKNTHEVSLFMALCKQYGVAVTPQSGNTGLVLGSQPFGEVLLSLKRMTSIREIDPLNDSITVDAGVTLADVQAHADGVERLFPLSLAAEGQACIGGVVSTNAGGTAVLRYGMMRDLVLGLEVVMPDGRIWNGLSGLRKDNTGYDLKQAFIGAEGTLGVVTGATLKMFPKPAWDGVAWLAVESPRSALELLAIMRTRTGGAVSSFELISANAQQLVFEQFADLRDPIAEATTDWRVLLEIGFPRKAGAQELFEDILGEAFEAGLAVDGAMAQSEMQARAFWTIRETVPMAERALGKAVKHDVSTPVSSTPEFLERATRAVESVAPEAQIIAFGHLGDGNIHYNVAPPPGVSFETFNAEFGARVTGAIYDLIGELGGSISAEHGIGLQKRDDLVARSPEVAMDMMRALKLAFDPENRMNPGRLVDVANGRKAQV